MFSVTSHALVWKLNCAVRRLAGCCSDEKVSLIGSQSEASDPEQPAWVFSLVEGYRSATWFCTLTAFLQPAGPSYSLAAGAWGHNRPVFFASSILVDLTDFSSFVTDCSDVMAKLVCAKEPAGVVSRYIIQHIPI